MADGGLADAGSGQPGSGQLSAPTPPSPPDSPAPGDPATVPNPPTPPSQPAAPTFPAVEGENIDGKRFRLPGDFEGDLNVVLIAFQRDQQEQVDTWVPALRQLGTEFKTVRYYELPTIKEMGRLMRWVITSGMSRGIDDPLARAATITLFIDKESFRTSLDIRHEDAITLVVVDRNGRVYWQTVGVYTAEKEKALRTVLGG
jgi:hypothetical protein